MRCTRHDTPHATAYGVRRDATAYVTAYGVRRVSMSHDMAAMSLTSQGTCLAQSHVIRHIRHDREASQLRREGSQPASHSQPEDPRYRPPVYRPPAQKGGTHGVAKHPSVPPMCREGKPASYTRRVVIVYVPPASPRYARLGVGGPHRQHSNASRNRPQPPRNVTDRGKPGFNRPGGQRVDRPRGKPGRDRPGSYRPRCDRPTVAVTVPQQLRP